MRGLLSACLWVVGLGYYLLSAVAALALTYLGPPRVIDPAVKAMMRGVFRVLFVRVRLRGVEHLDPQRPVVYYLAPHTSMLDVPLVSGFVPGHVRGVYAAGQDRWPLYGWAMRRLGNVSIERRDVHRSITTMKRAGAVLGEGASLALFPEGHRTTTGELLPFKKLPFHLAKEAGVPVVPVSIQGMFAVNHKGSWMVRPGTVTIHFGRAIAPDEVRRRSVVELRELVEARIREGLKGPEVPSGSMRSAKSPGRPASGA